MKKGNPYRKRLILLLSFLVAVLTVYAVLLVNYQGIHGDDYRALSMSSNATTETVEASRGVITDRNGKVLVSNRLTYTLKFSDDEFADDDAACNSAVWRLLELFQAKGITWNDPLPLAASAPYALTTSTPGATFTDWLDEYDIAYTGTDSITLSVTGAALLGELREIYQISADYTDAQARLIAGVRYGAETYGSAYVFAEDVSVELISEVIDGHFAGISTGTSSERVYNTTYAAHILGRISRIFAEDWDQYKDKDYSMDALVGEGGVEEAFEEYLHGTNGTKIILTDEDGKSTGELYTKQPQPGDTVALTIDIDLQKVAEDSLAEKISGMTEKDGVSRGGAAAVVSVGTGEVLALASYPTYDLSKFDELYDTWNSDASLPMFNRATDGTYAPGSTFKLCTSVAALESGIITPSTTIVDKGIYTYYEFPQPKCWIYSSYGGTHGAVNVSEAITVSCNYFFYEVGRLTGIETLDSYATQFGLGEHTGIEIGDSAGVLASPEYAESIGEDWTEGQVITAAIGQSYHLFTPLQLANYVATLVGGGDHYAAHLLKSVKTYDNSSVVYASNEEPLNHVDISESTLAAIKEGTQNLATGSLSSYFANCPVTVGCKTGTAETGSDLANGCFVAYAPVDDPQIAVCVVIEQGTAGANLASVAADIINAYFSNASASAAVEGENTLLP